VIGDEQRAAFARDGYTVVPEVLTGAQVAGLRTSLQALFDAPEESLPPGDSDTFLMDVLVRQPEIRWVLFHPPVLAALRGLLGDDFVVLPESVVQRNRFGGWHKDTTSQERTGLLFHRADDFLMVEAAIYLQDNSTEHGGGLDVVPGSHRTRDPYVRPSLTDKVRSKLGLPPSAPRRFTQVASRAGDLVLFDFRLDHRATPRTAPAEDKLAIFFAASSNTSHVASYVDFISGRPEYTYLQGRTVPGDLLEQARLAGVRIT
jgi:ectoine hydroxylase-related dioxygenase (phytanoyl-CoA dioxygenase family)